MIDEAFLQTTTARLAALPTVRAVTLGGSRAEGAQRPDSDWDFAIYYDGPFDPQDLRDVGWPGHVSEIGEWGPVSAHAILASRGEWVTNDKRLLARAGLRDVDALLTEPGADADSLGACARAVHERCETALAQAGVEVSRG